MGRRHPPPPYRAPSLCPATVSLTTSAGRFPCGVRSSPGHPPLTSPPPPPPHPEPAFARCPIAAPPFKCPIATDLTSELEDVEKVSKALAQQPPDSDKTIKLQEELHELVLPGPLLSAVHRGGAGGAVLHRRALPSVCGAVLPTSEGGWSPPHPPSPPTTDACGTP